MPNQMKHRKHPPLTPARTKSEHALTLLLAGCLLVTLAACGMVHTIRGADPDEAVTEWAESEVKLPAFPQPKNLLGFEGVRGSSNRYYIDAASLSIGKDGVVRYTMVIDVAGGARNITYEGMHCEATTQKYYAFGHPDGTWSPARSSEWRSFDVQDRSRPYRALFLEYFCPGRNYPVVSVEQAIDVLKHGPRLPGSE